MEGAVDVIAQIGQADFARFNGHGAGLDLGQVENIADERQQIGPGGIDSFGKLDLLGIQVALRILRQHPGQNEEIVQRCPQLMRHVRQELGLVLGGKRELFGFFLERLLGLLHLAVFALDLGVLLSQKPGFFFEFSIRIL